VAKVFVITGPSGVGKGTLIAELLRRVPGLELSVSATTRNIFCSRAYTKANPRPWKAVLANFPPFSPAISTEAQAVPSG